MPTPLIPQEIYLLERFCSVERYKEMRDAWKAMLDYAEDLLDRFVRKLPPDYRSRPLPEQPDIVWGERVLVNFRGTMQILNDGYIKRLHGDYGALGRANGVTGGVRGQTDFWSGWMDEVETGAEAKYYELLYRASGFAWPVKLTSGGTWSPGDLTTHYDKVIKEPLNPPSTWPLYRLNSQIKVKSGDRTPVTGIYLPDVDDSFPTLLRQSDDDIEGEANEAMIDLPDGTSTYKPAIWTLVERVADESDMPTAPSLSGTLMRCEAGKPCPRDGYWFTPAKANSRQRFAQGTIMPNIEGSDYGQTIWQWDAVQV